MAGLMVSSKTVECAIGEINIKKIIELFFKKGILYFYSRLENDLYNVVDLNLYTAMLGGEITVDTLNGKVKLTVKPETQNGSKVKLKGKGFPVYKNEDQFGDLFITYNIKTPTNLTEKQKELFTELSKS